MVFKRSQKRVVLVVVGPPQEPAMRAGHHDRWRWPDARAAVVGPARRQRQRLRLADATTPRRRVVVHDPQLVARRLSTAGSGRRSLRRGTFALPVQQQYTSAFTFSVIYTQTKALSAKNTLGDK
jgi:hypothetical protein